MRRLILAAAALVLASGCVSIGSMQTADTLGRNNFQFAVEPGVYGLAGITNSDVKTGVVPHIDIAARYGVSDTVDIGARFGSSLLELQSKFLLTDPNDPAKAISLAPAVAGIFAGGGDDVGGYANVTLPLLVGFKTSGGSEFVLGPRLTDTLIFGSSGSSTGSLNILSAGASIGFAARVGEGFRLMPEFALLVPLVGTASANGNSTSDVLSAFNGGVIQFKVGLLFGKGRRAPVPTMSNEHEQE